MEALLLHIQFTWGRASTCGHCKSQQITGLCGECLKISYCSVECLERDWTHEHYMKCAGSQGKKREREDGVEEHQDEFTIDFTAPGMNEMWRSKIIPWLQGSDVIHLRQASVQLEVLARRHFFATRRIHFAGTRIEDVERFVAIAPFLRSITIDSLRVIQHMRIICEEHKIQEPRIIDIVLSSLFVDRLSFQSTPLFNSTERLTFPQAYDRGGIGQLPPNLIYLKLSRFTAEIATLWPTRLEYLSLGSYWTKKLDNLPHSLTHVATGISYDFEDTKWPPNLTHFKCASAYFIEWIPFPDTVTHLALGTSNVDMTQTQFPPRLRELVLYYPSEFDGFLQNSIPPSVKVSYYQSYQEYDKLWF